MDMRLLRVAAVLCLTVSYSLAQAQSKFSPYSRGEGRTNTSTSRCALADERPLRFNWPKGPIEIYEAAENYRRLASSECATDRFSTAGACKRYFYLPLVVIDRVVQRGGAIDFYLSTMQPEMEELRKFIFHNGNPHVQAGNILPACVFAFAIDHPDANSRFVRDEEAGLSLSDNMHGRLQFPDEVTADRVFQGLQNGSDKLDFFFTINQKASQFTGAAISVKDIVESDAFRDFYQPVIDNGKKIFAFKHQNMSRSVLWEMRGRAVRDGHSDFNDRIFWDLWNEGLLEVQETRIAFADIVAGTDAARQLEDFESLRYHADEIKRLAYKARNESSNEWCDISQRIQSGNYESKNNGSSSWGGKATVPIKAITAVFGVGRNKNRVQEVKQSYSDTSYDQDCGKQAFHNSFEYEREGSVYIPKSIIAYEVISIKGNARSQVSIETYDLIQEYANKTISIKMRKYYE